MIEQWQELKETIIEMRDNDGTGTQQEVCKFLANYMDILKKQMQEPCEDAISREKAKQFLYERIDRLNDDELYDIFSKIVDDMYNELPSVNPQPKTGRWIEERTYMECPNCHDIWHYEKNQTQRFKCCPTCGKGLNNESKYIRNRV